MKITCQSETLENTFKVRARAEKAALVQADLCFDSHLINELAKCDGRFDREKMLSLDLEEDRNWISYHCKTSFLEDFLIRKINCLLEMLLSAKYWK